jgi:putative membrane protein
MRPQMYQRGLTMRQDNHYEWIGLLVGVVFWVALITLLVLVIKHLAQNARNSESSKSSALAILETRYAKGEIDKKEFESIKADLTN